MYKTYYTFDGFITKAENINDALLKFNNEIMKYRHNLRVKLLDVHELGKMEVIDLSDYITK